MDSDEYESLPTNDVATHMLAGALAGVMEHCVMYPLDSVKTRMQSLQPSPKANYKTVGEGLYKMVRYEGLFRPVRGINAVVIGAGPAHALYFSCYEKMKRVFSRSHTGSGSPLAQGAAGCLATLFHDAIMNPAEVVKQRMQVYRSPYRNCLDCFFSIWKLEGSRAFYRSYVTQLTMNLPFQCTHFMMYEFMQDLTNGERTYNPRAHMVSGAVAGAVAAAITTPLDVCKTLLNTQEQGMLTVAKQTQINGLLSAVAAVYKFRGLSGYFQGLRARVLYQMPSTAIAWSVYEFFKFWISERQGHGSESGSSASLFAALPPTETTVKATQASSMCCDDIMSTSSPVTTVCSSPLMS